VFGAMSERESVERAFNVAKKHHAAYVEERRRRLTVERENETARRIIAAYYDYHVEPGDPPCPCEPCRMAREFFAAVLASVLEKEADR
jgi:hypothetical protein